MMMTEEVQMIARPYALEEETRRPPRPALRARGRILLVEDDDDLRRLAAAVLRGDGYAVDEAVNGVGMLRQIEGAMWAETPAHFDVVVADILLPDLTAFEVLEALRSRELATPVILMTAYGGDDAREDACALGAFALLEKPLDWDVLRNAVRKAIQLGLRCRRPPRCPRSMRASGRRRRALRPSRSAGTSRRTTSRRWSRTSRAFRAGAGWRFSSTRASVPGRSSRAATASRR
jgi:CheY-like chemotaxis protein